MKAEELRIGNYVTITPHSKEDVLQLNQSEMESLYIFKNWDRLQPIPLTEEWLKMFGANCIGAKGWNFISVNKADTSYIYFNPNGIGLAIDNGTTENAIEVEIKYVHQLQNLYFALTNTELTIKTK